MSWRIRTQGFTLLELMLCLGLLGLLTGLALGPSMGNRLQDTRLDGFVQGFTNDMREARYQAIGEARPHQVLVRLSGYYLKHSDETQSYKYVAWPQGISIDTSYNDQNVTITFSTTGVYDAWSNNTIHFKNSRGTRRNVIISSGGRIRVG